MLMNTFIFVFCLIVLFLSYWTNTSQQSYLQDFPPSNCVQLVRLRSPKMILYCKNFSLTLMENIMRSRKRKNYEDLGNDKSDSQRIQLYLEKTP